MLSFLRPWFAHPIALTLVLLLPVLGIAALFSQRRRRKILARLAPAPALRVMSVNRGGSRIMAAMSLASGLVFLVAGIAGPQWGRDWEAMPAPGRDVVVVLDLSRSMLARDVLPNRAERGKRSIKNLADTIQERGGHRLGLVAFAARARTICPLTHDYDHFRAVLDALNPAQPPRELRPIGDAPASGTRIGAGLRQAVLVHDERFRGYQDIVLVSDGDDPARDEEWRLGAQDARARGIRVHTVGVGDPTEPSPIPGRDGKPLHYKNQLVTTRLEERPLELIARWTGGVYVPAGTSELPLGDLFRDWIEPAAEREEGDDALPMRQQHYAWFFGTALWLLGLDMALGGLRQWMAQLWQQRARARMASDRKEAGVVAALAGLVVFAAAGSLRPAAAEDLIRLGNNAFAAGDYGTALDCYTRAEDLTEDPGLVAFNEAAACYQLGRHRDAELHYRRAREDAQGERLARLLYGLGNSLVQQARGSDTSHLREAIKCYQECLHQPDLDVNLADDARHNLELARLLWSKARAAREYSGQPDAEPDEPNPLTGDRPNDAGAGGEDMAALRDPRGKPQALADPSAAAQAAANADQNPPPGRGNLPPIPDEDALAPLPPEDAAEYLRQAAVRIMREGTEYRRATQPTTSANVMDW